MTHFGQHGPDCFGCKVKTLHLYSDAPKTHMVNGNDPWTGNPVKERIEEIGGFEIDTDHLNRNRPPGAPGKGPNAYL